jgi:hypothetical protein
MHHPRLLIGRLSVSIQSRRNISDCPSGRFWCWCTDIVFFQNPPCMASRQLLITRISVVDTSFSPLSCQARHDHMVTNAHRVEIEVGADGPSGAPPPGPPPQRRRRAPGVGKGSVRCIHNDSADSVRTGGSERSLRLVSGYVDSCHG